MPAAGACIRGPGGCVDSSRTAKSRSRGDAMTAETLHIAAPARATIHPGWVRVCHWINALAILVMIGSGWQIYNASPLFSFMFPGAITIGGWLAGALLWHFAA